MGAAPAGPRPGDRTVTWTLAIATATPQVSVALVGPEGPAGEVTLRAGRRHGETLAPAIESLTTLIGVDLGRVERVAVDVGPGLFTGLRVGVATAKALASALSLEVVACSSLEVLAHRLRFTGRPVAAVVDARRGEVFWALYEPSGDAMVAATVAEVVDPAVLMEKLAGPALCTGDGARRYLAGDGRLDVAPGEYDHPSAAALAELASGRPGVAPELITPLYLRGADVRIGWEQR